VTAVTLDRVADLADADRDALRDLTQIVYPPELWSDWPGHSIEWGAAGWCVRVHDEGRLASHVGIHLRHATLDGKPVFVGGVGGVKTHPDFRRRGHAALGLRRAAEFFHEQPDVAFAVLVCEPDLLGYYSSLGWKEFGGTLLVRQRGTQGEFTFLKVMTLGVRSEAPAGGTIDLCGPPW
jgi:aminoglycoside 2'-N-acetyltransferase I